MEVNQAGNRLQVLEAEVRTLLRQRAAANVNALHEEKLTLGDRMADAVANTAGNWRFIATFLVALAAWMVANVAAAVHGQDPYRVRAENDFQVNVKAELLLEHLTEEIEALKRGMVSLGASFTGQDGDLNH